MKNTYATSLFDRMKTACSAEWKEYCQHEFVNRIGDGTLPVQLFRNYLMQDYVFLIHFCRAWALVVYKSDKISDMEWASEILHSTLTVEMQHHVDFSQKYSVSQAELEAVEEHSDNLAYSRFVLERGLAGDVLDLYVALCPCVVGYAEIGNRLALEFSSYLPGNPYREWIEMYSSEDYQALAIKTITRLDRLSQERGGNTRIDSLTEVFRKSIKLETSFWSMCYDP